MTSITRNQRAIWTTAMIAVVTVTFTTLNLANWRTTYGYQPTATPIPGNDVLEFLGQIVPGTTRWSEVSQTLASFGLSPYPAHNNQGQVNGYGLDISVPRFGFITPPYTQDLSADFGVEGDIISVVRLRINSVYAPNPTMPEVQWANVAAVFRRLGEPTHIRISVSQVATGEVSGMEVYWQDLGWFAQFGVGIDAFDHNGGSISLCYIANRVDSAYLGRVPPGTPLETMDVILENLPAVSTPLEPNMLLNAPDIATIRQRILNDECLKTRSDYWFVFVPEYISPTPWATDTPIPTATFTPTNTPTFTPTSTLTPSLTPTLPVKFDKLRLFPACSPDPATLRVWVVRNLNPFDLPFTWEVQGNREQGSGVAPANGEVTFTTHTIHPTANVVRLFVQGKVQDVSTSTSAPCPTPTPGG